MKTHEDKTPHEKAVKNLKTETLLAIISELRHSSWGWEKDRKEAAKAEIENRKVAK